MFALELHQQSRRLSNECVVVVVVGHQATRVSTASLCKLTIILINLCSAGHPLARACA